MWKGSESWEDYEPRGVKGMVLVNMVLVTMGFDLMRIKTQYGPSYGIFKKKKGEKKLQNGVKKPAMDAWVREGEQQQTMRLAIEVHKTDLSLTVQQRGAA